MTDRLPAPTYRQRFTDTGKVGLVMMIAAPINYGIILGAQDSATAWDRPSGLWFGIPGLLALIGPALLLVGREYYDATAEIEAAKVSATAPVDNGEPLAKMKVGR